MPLKPSIPANRNKKYLFVGLGGFRCMAALHACKYTRGRSSLHSTKCFDQQLRLFCAPLATARTVSHRCNYADKIPLPDRQHIIVLLCFYVRFSPLQPSSLLFFGDNKSQLDYLCIDIYGKQRQPYQEVRMAEFAVLQLCYMLIERIHVLVGLKMLCQLNKVLPLVAAITRLASASIGDRSNVHQECLQQCHTKNKCHEKAPARFVQGNVVFTQCKLLFL